MTDSSINYLPENYHHYKTLDLHDYKVMIILNLVAIGMLVPTIFAFNKLVNLLRPELSGVSLYPIRLSAKYILYIFIVSFIVIIVHELIHGVFFWINTRDKPIFAFKFLYAYAAAPEWYIPRVNFIAIGLSPVILITLLVIFLILIVPTSLIVIMSLAGIINFAGSTGDFVVILWILTQPKDCLLRDSGDSFDVYHQHYENDNNASLI
jgi:hypothetical protein